jgi:putative two-component system response regulator
MNNLTQTITLRGFNVFPQTTEIDKPMNKETILIVEDNRVLKEGLRDILTFEGFDVVTAAHGREALDQMEAATPDLILSDIAMPVMDGYEFFRSVRSRPDWVTIPFVFLTARGEKADVLAGKDLGVEDYLIKPLTREELLTAVRARLARARQLRVAQLQRAYEASLTMLANAIDVRDPYTRGHVERVTAYAHVVACELGWQGRKLDQLRFGAILHDIGKIHISETTLFKNGPLSNQEWHEIRDHPVTGSEMIKDIPYLAPAIAVVRHHHERWDGTGYPDGLMGEEIPMAARIIAVVDGFDAMTTDRPYRYACDLEEAYQEILEASDSQYDPAVVAAFQRAWDKGEIFPVWERWQTEKVA